jgi:ribosome-associated protein
MEYSELENRLQESGTEQFILGDGPGGQKVNKTHSTVRFTATLSELGLTGEELQRATQNLGPAYLTKGGELIVRSGEQRNRDQNRGAAIERAARLLYEAIQPEKPRTATKPSPAAKEQRLQGKHHQARKKAQRRDKPSITD